MTIEEKTTMADAPPQDPPEQDPPPADPPKQDPPPTDPPPQDPPKQDPPPEGFPADTKPEDMTQEQQTAYWKHQARRHEQSAKRLGDVTPEQYKAQQDELEKLRRDKMSDSDKALDDARKAGREEERKALQPKMVQAAFDAAVGKIDDEDEAKAVKDMVDALDFGSFITDDGAVDTARVQSVAGRITGSAIARPATSGYGGGKRQSTKASGVEAGREMFESSRKRPKSA